MPTDEHVPEKCLDAVRHMALDLDGTLYCGNRLIDGTLEFLETLDELGIGRSFVTNNSSHSNAEYVARLQGLGIGAELDDIFTSTDAVIEVLKTRLPRARRLYVLGTPALHTQLAESGYDVAGTADAVPPDAVVVGYDATLDYPRLCKTAWWIQQGTPYLATNPDRVCPTDQPTLLVDCGSICAALEHATGRAPDEVAGKPNPRMLDGIRRKHGLAHGELAMVGDRLYTDIEMARAAGAVGVLVLSGEATAADAARSPTAADLVAPDVGHLARMLRQVFRK